MSPQMHKIRLIFFFACIIVAAGCASFKPYPMEDTALQARAQTLSKDNMSVTAAVLSSEESKSFFGVSLYRNGVQPVWLKIENRDDKPVWFLPFSVDPDYFSPLEVTYPFHRTFNRQYNDQIDRFFLEHAMGLFVAPGSSRSGFVFTNLDLGTKGFNVDLVGDDNRAKTFTFFISVPGLRADHQDVDFDNLYSAGEVVLYNEANFKNALKILPCCTTNQDSTREALPINVIMVANGEDLLRVLIRAGWNETATLNKSSSAGKPLLPDLPQSYRYKSIAPLYYYGRHQDASFRETRASGFERNQLRLWLSPMRFEGTEVWIGQITREYGEQSPTGKSQKINLDEVRAFLLQNLWYAQGIEKYAFVKGVGAAATISNPRKTFRETTYVTDGYRVVLWMSRDPVTLSNVEVIDWDIPPQW